MMFVRRGRRQGRSVRRCPHLAGLAKWVSLANSAEVFWLIFTHGRNFDLVDGSLMEWLNGCLD